MRRSARRRSATANWGARKRAGSRRWPGEALQAAQAHSRVAAGAPAAPRDRIETGEASETHGAAPGSEGPESIPRAARYRVLRLGAPAFLSPGDLAARRTDDAPRPRLLGARAGLSRPQSRRGRG